MKRLFFYAILSIFVSCGTGSEPGTDAKKLAKEVCDCYKNANSGSAADPAKGGNQTACITKQMDAWNKIKDDKKQSEEFNREITECGKELKKNTQ